LGGVCVSSTGNEATDKLIGVEFTGNVIHQNWYKTVLLDNGKPDAISIMLLADIVYWYRPAEIRDETTGRTISFGKKFKSDLLQRTYESFSEQMGFTKRQVQESIKRLETIGVITRIFRTVKFGDLVCYNVLYIQLNFDNLMAITFDGIPSHIIMCHPLQGSVIPPTPECGTNTKITPEITTKNKTTTCQASIVMPTAVAPILKNNDDKLPKGIKPSLIAKLSAMHGAEPVQVQLKNLKSALTTRKINNVAGWLTTAVCEGFDSKVELNLFKVQENKDLETKLVEKLESDSSAQHEFVNQDFMKSLIAKHGCVSDMIAGASVNG